MSKIWVVFKKDGGKKCNVPTLQQVSGKEKLERKNKMLIAVRQ